LACCFHHLLLLLLLLVTASSMDGILTSTSTPLSTIL
jgi:hypothetical protein